MAYELTAAFGRQLRTQANVFSRRQALNGGYPSSAIHARVQRGTWRSLYPGVYLSATSDLRYRGRLWAAVLYAGRGAVLSHETAAWLHGFGKPADAIHVTIPVDRQVSKPDGVRIHRSGRVFAAAMRYESPPRTSPAETVLDLVDQSGSFTDVCGWISRAISAGVTDEARLLEAMRERKRLRWRRELMPVIVAVVEGDESALETRYTFSVERRHGLPESERQVRFTKPDGTTGRRDRLYRDFGLIVELDGRLGHEGEYVKQDRARDRAATAVGQQTVRFGWDEIRGASCASAAEVAATLRERGWTGVPRPCSLSCRVGVQT
ncbi:MAG TPA: hypothetical protein VGG16_00745 [Streptosporangiaceae bacterium]|jgi:hypothetical protein